MRKGQGTIMWIVVFGVLALIVMGILIYSFTKPTTQLGQVISQCEPDNGVCQEAGSCLIPLRNFQCPGEKVCCGGFT